MAGDKSGSSAAFLLKVVVGIVMAIGGVITLLSLFVLMLSVSLLMEKNRGVIHRLLMLGAPLRKIGAPYSAMIWAGCGAAWLLSVGALIALRSIYAGALEGFGATAGGLLWGIGVGTLLAFTVMAVNVMSVRRKVKSAWSLRMSHAG